MIRISQKLLWVLGLFGLTIIIPSILFSIQFFATTPVACKSCHPDLFTLWEKSKVHPKDKSDCLDCHIHKKYQIKPIYSSEQKTVSNNCISCHEDLFEQTQIQKVKLIKISHKKHLQENITCFECHRNVAHDKVSPATYRPRKKMCLRCHIREIEGSLEDEACMMCHYITLDQKTNLFFGS